MSEHTSIPLGDGLAHLAVLVWLSVAVGPWWVGLTIFLVAIAVNVVVMNPHKFRRAPRSGGGSDRT